MEIGFVSSDVPAKRKRGQQPYIVTDEVRNTVTVLYANGISHAAIARALKITEPTLRKYYRQELNNAFEDLKARMVSTLTRQALNGNSNALKFWLATRCPEWRIPKDEAEALARATMDSEDATESVHIYMPSNGRDGPDEEEPPTIDLTVDDEADAA